MSFSSTDSLSLGSLGADAGIPSLNVADIPENVRDGNDQAKQAYVEGLAFEQVLVNQMTQQMASSMSGSTSTDGSSSYGYSSYGSSSGSSGGMSGSSAMSGFSSLIPQALTEGIMSGGGLGMADEFAAAIDPSLNQPTAGTGSDAAAGNSSGADDNVTITSNGAAGL